MTLEKIKEEHTIVHVVVSVKCNTCGHEFDVTFMEIYPKTEGRMVQTRCPKCFMFFGVWLYL